MTFIGMHERSKARLFTLVIRLLFPIPDFQRLYRIRVLVAEPDVCPDVEFVWFAHDFGFQDPSGCRRLASSHR
jgi:hypothetical protein